MNTVCSWYIVDGLQGCIKGTQVFVETAKRPVVLILIF